MIRESYQLGLPLIKQIPFDEFDAWPNCISDAQGVTYSLRLLSGLPLPPQITLDAKKRLLIVQDDGALSGGDLNIIITGRATDSNAKDSLQVSLQLVNPDSKVLSLSLADYQEIPPTTLAVHPGEQRDFIPTAFPN